MLEPKQLNMGMIDPQIIQAFEVWYQKLKVSFMEQGLPAPHKKDVAGVILRTVPYFLDKWWFSPAELDAIQSWRQAQKEASKEELREFVTGFFRKRLDELVDSIIPLVEKAMEEKRC